MAHPYQCLLYCHRPESDISQILIAASGAYIHTFSVSDGRHLSSWPSTNESIVHNHERMTSVFRIEEDRSSRGGYDESQPPPKRRKTSPRPVISNESSSAEIVVEDDEIAHDFHSNPVIKLASTSKGRHVVAVTAEDKCIRVFELTENGVMHQVSERIMPKKPCAITLTLDDSAILCADKFGDVYSLPLLGKSRESEDTQRNFDETLDKDSSKTAVRKYKPSATSLTVHSKRNLNALKQQLRQQEQDLDRKVSEKRSLLFDHQLILGHVSLLTDIICGSVSADKVGRREYILTSDRDEHIRVSRGIPQAYVIEGYCLGHTQFVSKLCFIPSKPRLLISGGGDDFLLLWDWPAGVIKQRAALHGVVEAVINNCNLERSGTRTEAENAKANGAVPRSDNEPKIAVSNLKVLEMPGSGTGEGQTEIIITCEGVPSLFLFTFDESNGIVFREAYPTEGNVIDIVVLQDRRSVIYSMDNIYEPASTTNIRRDSTSIPLVEAIHFLQEPQRWEEDLNLDMDLLPALEKQARCRPMLSQKDVAKGKSLTELLYSLENLRKREVGVDGTATSTAENAVVV